MRLTFRSALALIAVFSILALVLLARTRGDEETFSTTVTCSIRVQSDRAWIVILENRWRFRVFVPDNSRFKPNPCQVKSIIFDEGSETILATVQVPGGLIPLRISKDELF
jgi:hypothetical protein